MSKSPPNSPASARFAHTLPNRPHDEWEPLEQHLREVARRAAEFAAAFHASDWGKLAGLWHDLGKYSDRFQDYLCASHDRIGSTDQPRRGSVDHATAGAQHAVQRSAVVGRLMAYCVAGHHTGLLNAIDNGGETSDLASRLRKSIDPIVGVPDEIISAELPTWPPFDWKKQLSDFAFQLSVFCRMLFSCLVDADFLATEEFMDRGRADRRVRPAPTVAQLLAALNEHLSDLETKSKSTPVNYRRREVLALCRSKATEPPGLFSLTVPTGGGKTLSSLAFALTHAVHHGLCRVIYAIPFTSIIEQNAMVFRDALKGAGDQAVLEHHSSFERQPSQNSLPDHQEFYWDQLATENWDAPVVVTTNVQLFESLFASKTSRCRKLHRIARSVIVLDEVQTLPVHLLRPTLAMLDELCRNYGCTVVLCSATQPAIQWHEDFAIGLRGVREIVSDPPTLFGALKRVDIERIGHIDDVDLVGRLTTHDQVLCVVNTRAHAAKLFEILKGQATGDVFHLSASMCAEHRTNVLSAIRDRLNPDDPQPCRVISTQLVEAGVDIDFPVVYRAMTGVDSIAQAAGRCNREGRLDTGRVYVFETDVDPCGDLRRRRQVGEEVAALHDELLGLETVERYFSMLYWTQKDEWDKRDIMKCFSLNKKNELNAKFRDAAEAYKLIDNEQQSIIVPYGDKGRRLIDKLRGMSEPPGRGFARRAQRYSVGVYRWQLETLIKNAQVGLYHEKFWVLEMSGVYDDQFGLLMDGTTPDQGQFIV